MIALVAMHACLWWLGVNLPVMDSLWMLPVTGVIVAFPAVVYTFYHFVMQKGRFFWYRAIWLCQIVPVVVGILVSGFWYSLKNYYVPGYLDCVIIPVTAVINVVCGFALALLYTGLRTLTSSNAANRNKSCERLQE